MATHGVDIDVDAIPFDDPKIFELMSSGHTAGVFQVESGGMTATIKKMKPREYKHVVALIALYHAAISESAWWTATSTAMNGKEAAVSYDRASTTSWARPTAPWSTRSRSCRSR